MNRSFTVPAGALGRAVKYCARWLNPKPVIPAHAGLLFEVDGDRVSIFGFNEHVTAKAVLAIDATDEPTGSFVVSGRLLDSLVSTFPDKPVRFEQHGSLIQVTAGSWRGTLPAMAGKDYPALPGAAELAGWADGVSLADIVHRTGVAASRDASNRVEMTGIHLTMDADSMTALATDSYRAVRQAIDFRGDDGEGAEGIGQMALVPAHVLVEAADAFAGPDAVAVGNDGGLFSLSTPERSLVVAKLDPQKFPASGLNPIIDSATDAAATFNAKSLLLPLKRASMMRTKDTVAMRLALTEGLLTISSESVAGSGDEEIEVAYDGPDVVALIKPAPFADAISSAPGDRITMSLNVASFSAPKPKPIVFTADGDSTWKHIVMPLTNAGGSK